MAKKFYIALLILVVITFTAGCSESYEKTEIEVQVTKCEIGSYHKNVAYQNTASMYLMKKDYSMYNLYSQLANSNGYYDYFITFVLDDGTERTVIRSKAYGVGETIKITVHEYEDRIEYK